MSSISHQAIRQSVLERIHSGEWPLGSLIPGEIELAKEYDCARTTVNRALRTLAEEGLIVRKRKGGTRVCAMPVRQAKFEISIIREQVEASGNAYHHKMLQQQIMPPPKAVATRLNIGPDVEALHLRTTHHSDGEPYAYEDRWVNLEAVPTIIDAPLDTVSANEWLVKTVPLSSGDVSFSAINADDQIAQALNAKPGTALFTVKRTTWLAERVITTMTLYYHEGYQLSSRI